MDGIRAKKERRAGPIIKKTGNKKGVKVVLHV